LTPAFGPVHFATKSGASGARLRFGGIALIARLFAVLCALVLLSGAAQSQGAPPPAPSPLRTALETARIELEQAEAALRRPTLSGGELQDLRARIDPITERLREVVAEIDPQVEAARARLEQLGPKPKEGAPAEGAEVARDRAEREAATATLADTQRLARASLLQSEQLVSQISDRRRAAFTRALFERSYSILSPDLWVATAAALPRDLRALRLAFGDFWTRFEGRSSPATLTLVGLAIGVFIALHLVRRHIAPHLVRRDAALPEVDRHRRVVTGFAILAIDALPAAAGSFVVYQILLAADFIPPRLVPVAAAILAGIAFLAFLRALVRALLPPEKPSWRLLPLSDAGASRTASFLIAFGTVLILGRVLDGLNQAIAAALPLSVATRGLIAVAAALILAEFLRRFARTASSDEACLGPYVPSEPEIGGPLRLLGWALVCAVLGSAAAGYVAFAAFLADQIAWIGSIAALLYVGMALADELIGGTLTRDTRISTTLQANLGVRRRSLERLGVLGAGIARVVLVIAAAMLALAPWGIESGDLASNLRAAFFGFTVGDVTISLSTTILALLLFGLGVAATRIVQGWLDRRFLPTTDLDAGLRNSISTAIGYLGYFAAAAVAFSYLGLGLDKIAIVAGALSVGIGFGLQSIVNNFVSGLILLWERPIRVGDLVVIGDGEGYVRRISVRATEIETFDRASVIIPNSNLISGVVKNRVRGGRTGRVTVSVTLGRDQDPTRAAALLMEEAGRHPDVLAEPPPRVLFKRIGDTSLDFDLVAFVSDVTTQLRVQSDLNFAVFKALVGARLIPMPGPPAPLDIAGLESVRAALQHIGDALARERGEAEKSGSAPEREVARQAART
jgi:small-conductance mechanosensitive channel